MPFVKGKSGNPSGRPKAILADGRTVSSLAREFTEDAIKVIVAVMNDKNETGAARVAAADKILSRGWGQAPQSMTVTDDRQPKDLSTLSTHQLEALEAIRTLEPLDAGTAGNC